MSSSVTSGFSTTCGIDTARAKELLQSTDISELQIVVTEYMDYEAETEGEEKQIWKLLLLLQNRILQLQIANKTDDKLLSVTYAGIAEIWNRFNDVERCYGQLQKAVEKDPTNVQATLLLAQTYVKVQNYDAAIEYYEKSIELQKPFETAYRISKTYSKLAQIYETKCDFDKACDVIQNAIKDDCIINNENEYNHNNNDDDETIITKINLIKSKALASLYGHLGTIQEKMGNYSDAVISLSNALIYFKEIYGTNHPKTQEVEYLLEMASAVS